MVLFYISNSMVYYKYGARNIKYSYITNYSFYFVLELYKFNTFKGMKIVELEPNSFQTFRFP